MFIFKMLNFSAQMTQIAVQVKLDLVNFLPLTKILLNSQIGQLCRPLARPSGVDRYKSKMF
jgi:hypothetical protein